ncbi:putative DsbA family dithiol-disulfide isomerase [Leucobacter komagatae]|uniref:Putative DsbA family dithiol-disulfide isomerase n=1 Tax=Leucobacter komagatae TaxID=55969 RepID=A0A542Y5G4_9MICO|nr:DsbA family oxidoreductase [Leucobacter komagatae]TQL43328.1 putative DsbA family dithiol-disulfide isomerase [Leucobacter komagatae]
MSNTIRIDIWSDIACPWCYIGANRFRKAVEQFRTDNPEVEFEIEGHSYELAPDTPLNFEGSEIDFLVKHKGMPREQVEDMLGQMTAMAAAEGITFDFDRVAHSNTAAAHRVLHLAKEQGIYDEVLARLFKAYFEEGVNVGDPEQIAKVVDEVGLDPDEVRDAFEDEGFGESVESDITRARMLGVTGVPFYLINEKYGVSGAQQPEMFVSAFEQVLTLEAEANSAD